MRRTKHTISFTIFLLLFFSRAFSLHAEAEAAPEDRWDELRAKYLEEEDTDRLIFVQYEGDSRCRVEMYQKTQEDIPDWEMILSCNGYVGEEGLGKSEEGDRKTPEGTYRISGAFGILDNPGTQIPYTKLNESLYWSEEPDTYNTMVDARELGYIPAGEHLIACAPYYDYALVIDYNKDCVPGAGSAIFLHCAGEKTYTSGCVSIEEDQMELVMLNVTEKTRICIY